jgi:GntR family transcriptional regulator, transcriptional repressor for pyruvate dehydrogenase complex
MSTTAQDSNRRFEPCPVDRPRAQVEQQLKEAILSGLFAHGDKLPSETELAEKFGVSRPTIREALSGLVSTRLIHKASRGSFVNMVTPDSLSQMLRESMDTILRLGALNIRELTDLRCVLEIPAARLAAQHRSEEHVAKLREIVEQQRVSTIDDPRISAYDLAFHSIVGQASGNRLLAALIASVHDATHPAQYLDITPEVGRRTVKQHMAIVEVIEARNAAGAAAAMETHLKYVLRYSTNHSGGTAL